ncbi:hypothetical protein [Spiroplasma endosymbiont of Crioceris asparagi]|uniref:hypothetical protein n=1 Tax=Spiroplasma endosymbiont of Crioceris asparagi TaxID=3066286 RepID=UPI0030D30638
MANFDLYILYPIFIILGFVSFFFVIQKEKLKGDRLLFCFKTIFFWIVTGFSGFEILKQSNIVPSGAFNNSLFMVMSIFGTVFLSIVLRPIYSFLVFKIFKKQKKLFYLVYLFQVFMILLLFLNKNLESSHTLLIVLASICYGGCISVSTTEFLFFNEQFFYKISAQAITWIIVTSSFLGNFIGLYIFCLTQKDLGPNAPLYMSKATNIYIHIFMLLIVFFVVYATKKIKEDPKLSGIYDEVFLTNLRPYKKRIGFLLILMAILLGFIFGINNSAIVENLILSFLAQSDHLTSANYNMVSRAFFISYFALAAILSYPIYHFIIKKILLSYTIASFIGIIIIDYIGMIFVRDGMVMLGLLFISNFVFSQLMYMLFSLALSWQYRTKFFALSSIIISSSIIGVYVINILIAILDISSNTVFYNTHKFFAYYETNGMDSDKYSKMDLIGTIMLLVAAIIMMVWLIIFHFAKSEIISEIDNFSKSRQLSKKLVQLSIIEKSKIPLTLNKSNYDFESDILLNENLENDPKVKNSNFLSYDVLIDEVVEPHKKNKNEIDEIDEFALDSDEF